MTKREGFSVRARQATLLAVAGLLLANLGDSQSAASGRGIDPLQVLDLQVKPNVIVVLDSSGSMQETVGGLDQSSGDHPRAKLYLAKQVLKQVVQNNANKVTFLFGQYTQDIYNPGTPAFAGVTTSTTGSQLQATGAGGSRFRYSLQTTTAMSPDLTLTKTVADAAGADTTGRGFQAWQDIRAGWNTLYFVEGTKTCAVTVAAQFYSKGDDLATALKNAMNGCAGRPTTVNNYFVTFDPTRGRFTFGLCAGSNNPAGSGCTAGGGNNQFSIHWSDTPNNIAGALNKAGAGSTTAGTGTQLSGTSLSMLRRTNTDEFTETYDFDGNGTLDTVYDYNFIAGRFFNGETINVLSDGTLCSVIAATAATATNPPTFTLQQVSSCGGTATGPALTFKFSGGSFGGNSVSCNGFSAKVPLVPCDQTSGQLALITPFLQNEIPLNTDGTLVNYAEVQDGTFAMDTNARPVVGPAGGIKADGSTPIANSLRDIKTLFNTLWSTGQASPAVTAISTHSNPKERTIIIFVTDGDDTCTGSGDAAALAAAYRAQLLYDRIVATEPASSVSTYMVGFGNGAQVDRLNWIAWGGSGLTEPNDGTRWTTTPPTGGVPPSGPPPTGCPTCINAFIAPDQATLSNILQSILSQGASSGTFTTEAGLIESAFELTGEIPATPGLTFSPDDPKTRYRGIVPILFSSFFTLPGFNGDLQATTNDGTATGLLRWSAGQRLLDLVTQGPGNNGTGTASCGDNAVPNSGLCAFQSLTTKIQRHIYTTSTNGVFPVTVSNYFDTAWLRTSGNRAILWPPVPDVNPAAGTIGAFDGALGISSLTIAELQNEFHACQGSPVLPASCTAGGTTQLDAAKKEAREMILAYMAGATTIPDSSGAPSRTGGGVILYTARSWVLGESTLADLVVVPQPISVRPDATGWGTEYALMTQGPRDTSAPPVATNGTDVGLGLRDPDSDKATPGADTRSALKPVMTMLYMPGNDMLHALRAAPSAASTTSACTVSSTKDCGGEEVWGFVPFDQILNLRMRMQPQNRANHTYMLASPIRFADVFVPNAGTTGNYDDSTVTHTVSGATTAPMKGVWRRIIFFGRGIGGKYVTALDVTSPGPYTRTTKSATSIIPPIPLWNRGNPDTVDGTSGGTANNTAADKTAFAKMGETWSTPSFGWVDKLPTSRKPCAGASVAATVCADQSGGGVSFALFMGSGYGNPGEGTTLFTLDALTGDVIATADVGSRATAPAGGYANAIVASPSLYLKGDVFVSQFAAHPSGTKATRVYFGDLDGRLWKVLARHPGTPILFADLGVNQPIATAVSLATLPVTGGKPQIYVTTGNDSRADPNSTGSFINAGFQDDVASDDDTTPSSTPSITGCAVLNPQPPCVFALNFAIDFRGTIQPASVLESVSGPLAVFFGGTVFVPPPPLSPRSTPVPPFPCRSRFDSIIYALNGASGVAAFDLNATGDDSSVIFTDRRIGSITVGQDPNYGAQVNLGDTVRSSPPPPPPPPGQKPAAAQTVTTVAPPVPQSSVCRTQ